MHVDESYVDELGWAHSGLLNLREVHEIRAERVRREQLYEEATNGVASGAAHRRITRAEPEEANIVDYES